MAQIIVLNKEEKMAILKMMIDINNFYNRVGRLPEGVEYIQKVANYLNMQNEIAEAYRLSSTAACSILENALKNDYYKECFVGAIFSNLLLDKTTYGDKTFATHCDDAIHMTKSFIRTNCYSRWTRDPLNSTEYLIIDDVSSSQRVSANQNTNSNIVSSSDSINDVLYKDL